MLLSLSASCWSLCVSGQPVAVCVCARVSSPRRVALGNISTHGTHKTQRATLLHSHDTESKTSTHKTHSQDTVTKTQ